ncbi:MAG: STAS domain-containing protein [Phycisphaerae bacterium]
MDIDVERRDDDIFVVTCPPELGWKARVDLLGAVQEHIDGCDVRAVILDFDTVEHLNSAGIGAIFTLRKHLKTKDAGMAICCANDTIRRLFRTVNLEAMICVTDTRSEAIAKFNSTKPSA